jgi:hypothetical protein
MAGARKKGNRTAAARKGWETRRAHERERAERARRGWATRERKRLAELEAARRRHEAAIKGHRTRAAKADVSAALRAMLQLKAEGASEYEWERRWGQKEGAGVLVRPGWDALKRELYDAVDEDFDRYADILQDIADECDTDWAIAYGPDL